VCLILCCLISTELSFVEFEIVESNLVVTVEERLEERIQSRRMRMGRVLESEGRRVRLKIDYELL
jgi:hypothetical protein